MKNADRILLLLPFVFAVMSIVMIGSTAYEDSFIINRDIVVQLIGFFLGAVFIFLIMLIDYEQYQSISRIMYVLCIVLMLLVYTPLGVTKFGARAWINLGVTTVQPCEFVKILFTLCYAKYLSEHRTDLQRFRGLVKAVLYPAPILVLIMKEDLGNALVFMFMMIVMIYVAGVDFKLYMRCAAASIASMPILYQFLADHQKNRINSFLHPDADLAGTGLQVWRSKIAIGSGGFTGKGLFQGTQKSLGNIPVAKSDFIFSVIGEELGFLGGAFVIGLYGLFIYRIIKTVDRAKDMYGMLIAAGFGAMFFFQIFENIGMTIGIMPVTGITLPFLSCGGTSVMANMISLGLVISVGQRSKIINF
ncbi:MAG: FtsW/RodA/SpoVE family cell cycle protein [Anaerovoracaceae bacterium]